MSYCLPGRRNKPPGIAVKQNNEVFWRGLPAVPLGVVLRKVSGGRCAFLNAHQCETALMDVSREFTEGIAGKVAADR